MPTLPGLPVLPRFALLAVTGAAALSVAALSAPATAHAEGDRAIGPITSVSGDSFEVAGSSGTTRVEFSDATKIGEAVPAQRGEITVGSCLKAGPGPDGAGTGDGAITAKWVMISSAVDGKCPQRPAGDDAAHQHHGVRGVVTSVSGDTVTLTRQDDSTATVTVTDDTHYRKRTPADAHAIAQGKCAAARGDTDGNGVLQARKVTVWAATNGECPQPAG